MKVGRNDPCPCGSGEKYKKCCLHHAAGLSALTAPKVLFLFGAGASCGAGGIIPETPPLGDELYGRLVATFPETWGCFSKEKQFKEIHDIFIQTKNFEKGMALVRNLPDYIYYWNAVAIYFVRFRISTPNTNSYCQLTDKYYSDIKSQKIILSTINYDCLLDCAISRLNPEFTYWGNGPGIKILKIHGACNFLPDIGGLQGTTKINLIWPATSKIPIKAFGKLDEIEKVINRDNIAKGIPVAMRLYTADKDIIGGGQELELIQKEFESYIAKVKMVIVIGVKPNPEDRHIWGHLKNIAGKIFLVGGKIECENWAEKYRPKDQNVWLESTFAQALPIIYKKIDEILL